VRRNNMFGWEHVAEVWSCCRLACAKTAYGILRTMYVTDKV